MSKQRKPFDDWTSDFPSVPGHYWFYGERYAPMGNDAPYKELILCEIFRVNGGTMMVGNGQHMYQSEFGKLWWFKKAKLPRPPAADREG